jgi:hypothetical protein
MFLLTTNLVKKQTRHIDQFVEKKYYYLLIKKETTTHRPIMKTRSSTARNRNNAALAADKRYNVSLTADRRNQHIRRKSGVPKRATQTAKAKHGLRMAALEDRGLATMRVRPSGVAKSTCSVHAFITESPRHDVDGLYGIDDLAWKFSYMSYLNIDEFRVGLDLIGIPYLLHFAEHLKQNRLKIKHDAATKTSFAFIDNILSGTQVYITKIPANASIYNATDVVVVSFRGTEANRPEDIITDLRVLNITSLDSGIFHPYRLHEGFLRAYLSVRRSLMHLLHRVLATAHGVCGKRIVPVLVTGHSLGGALAHCCAYDLMQLADTQSQSTTPLVYLVTFAAPSVGSDAFAKNLKSRLNNQPFAANLSASMAKKLASINTPLFIRRHASPLDIVTYIPPFMKNPGIKVCIGCKMSMHPLVSYIVSQMEYDTLQEYAQMVDQYFKYICRQNHEMCNWSKQEVAGYKVRTLIPNMPSYILNVWNETRKSNSWTELIYLSDTNTIIRKNCLYPFQTNYRTLQCSEDDEPDPFNATRRDLVDDDDYMPFFV